MGVFLGFDPGGANAFGWCVARGNTLPLQILQTGNGRHARDSFDQAMQVVAGRTVDAVGIDSPLFWRSDGDRQVDSIVRTEIIRLGSPGGTVNSVNSMRGACLVQGVAVGMLARQALGVKTPLTESHPKAALWLLNIATRNNPPSGIALAKLSEFFSGELVGSSDHERDAAIGALTAFAMTNCLDGWHDLFPHETDPLLPLRPPIGYWMPWNSRSDR